MTDEPSTEQLKALQLEKETTEHKLARAVPDESEAAQHERRADKAHYLKEKLEERARSERDAEGEENSPPPQASASEPGRRD